MKVQGNKFKFYSVSLSVLHSKAVNRFMLIGSKLLSSLLEIFGASISVSLSACLFIHDFRRESYIFLTRKTETAYKEYNTYCVNGRLICRV